MEKAIQTWKTLPIKEKIQYACATLLIIAGITMGFTSFFMIHAIESGALMFIGECLVCAGGLFGISLFINDKIQAFNNKVKETLDEVKTIARSN